VHFIDKSSIVTEESSNDTYLLKMQRYSRTDCLQLPTAVTANKILHAEQSVSWAKERLGLITNFLVPSMTGFTQLPKTRTAKYR